MQRQLDDKTFVCGQITPEELPGIKELGVTMIVNNRPDDEDEGQPTSAEIEAATSCGMKSPCADRAGWARRCQRWRGVAGGRRRKMFAYCLSASLDFAWACAERRFRPARGARRCADGAVQLAPGHI